MEILKKSNIVSTYCFKKYVIFLQNIQIIFLSIFSDKYYQLIFKETSNLWLSFSSMKSNSGILLVHTIHSLREYFVRNFN